MKHNIDDLNLNNKQWTKADDLLVDLPSMEKGFQETKRRQQEIWDYIQYRESLLKWPSNKEETRKNG